MDTSSKEASAFAGATSMKSLSIVPPTLEVEPGGLNLPGNWLLISLSMPYEPNHLYSTKMAASLTWGGHFLKDFKMGFFCI